MPESGGESFEPSVGFAEGGLSVREMSTQRQQRRARVRQNWIRRKMRWFNKEGSTANFVYRPSQRMSYACMMSWKRWIPLRHRSKR